MCIEKLNQLLRFEETMLLPPPSPLVKITNQEIIAKLKEKFPNAMILMSDSYYLTTTKEELMRFLKSDDTNEYKYVAEYRDCDDFSFRLMGQIHCVDWGALSFGILWVNIINANNEVIGRHAVNIFVDDQQQIWICEPQSDAITEINPTWVPYVIMI